jgi:hypothetical protein
MKSKPNIVSAQVAPFVSSDAVRINAGSVIYGDRWLNFGATVYLVKDYIASVVVKPRLKFFTNRDWALMLMVGIDQNGAITAVEGPQVKYTTNDAVPFPGVGNLLPLVGIILVQDGSTDLVNGLKPLTDASLKFLSGSGNVLPPDLVGETGMNSDVVGHTGPEGITGFIGSTGVRGYTGMAGSEGPTELGQAGATGQQGMTGISWDINLPFEEFLA